MPRRIIAIVDDMFFASKIRATAEEALDVEISFPRTKDATFEKSRDNKPDLILVDLHNQRFDPIEFATELKNDKDLHAIPLLGFFSHVEVDLQRRAKAAGFDNVIPRSVFARDLGAILKDD